MEAVSAVEAREAVARATAEVAVAEERRTQRRRTWSVAQSDPGRAWVDSRARSGATSRAARRVAR